MEHTKYKRNHVLLLLITVLIFLGACGANGVDDFESKFMNQYLQLVKNIYSPEVDIIIEKLQSDESKVILENISEILEDNSRFSDSKRYIELNELYTGLVDLKMSYKKWDTYDLDKQFFLNSQLNYIYVYYSQLEYEKTKEN